MRGKNYKQFQMNTIDDYVIVFRFLIGDAYTAIEKFKKTLAKEKIRLKKLKEQNIKIMGELEYSEIKNNILNYQKNLLKIFIDQQKSSYSYKSVRERIKKQKLINLEEFSQEINEKINELVNIRNLVSHNPQGDIHSRLMAVKNSVPKELQKYVIPNTSSYLQITLNEFVDVEFYESMINHFEKRLNFFIELFDLMKKDFFVIKGEEIKIEVVYIDEPFSFFHPEVEAANILFDIQKRKLTDD